MFGLVAHFMLVNMARGPTTCTRLPIGCLLGLQLLQQMGHSKGILRATCTIRHLDTDDNGRDNEGRLSDFGAHRIGRTTTAGH